MKTTLYALAALIAGVSAVRAQAPPAAATPEVPTAPAAAAAENCGPTRSLPSRGTVPEGGTTTGQRHEPLSDQLAKSDGVLCPPEGVDPDIHAPTPDTGSMPVIPPPGSPGGDPTVRPK